MNPLFQNFKVMWGELSSKNRKRFYALIALILALSTFEAASLGALVPFLTALTMPQKILDNELLMSVLSPLGFIDQAQIATAATVLFIAVTVITGLLRFAVLKLQFSFAHLSSNDIAVAIFRKTIHQEYEAISQINSSEIVSALTSKTTQLINSALMPILQLMSAITVFLVLIIGLLIIDWQLTLGLASALVLTYSFFILLTRRKISFNSKTASFEYDLLVRVIQETFGGIREVILGNHKNAASIRFDKSVTTLRASQASTLFLAASPKLLIEVLVFVLVAIIAYLAFFESGSMVMSIPTLGALAYAAQRLLPVIQQIYANILSINGCKHLVQDLCTFLEHKPQISNTFRKHQSIFSYNKKIELKEVSFKYLGSDECALKNINLEICSGDRIGIFGKTGSGKSTLLDIIMGLLQPTSGEIFCDGSNQSELNREDWLSIFSHVPQSIFLADTSVWKNIGGLGSNVAVDKSRVLNVAELAHVRDDIENFTHGFDTIVGERGVRLSGGQMQRIGIARALYEKSSILVLDEATSAIDPFIEEKIESSLSAINEDITIIKVAHRISTLKSCNIIYKVDGGEIVQSGNYETFFGS
jgi:ATP-binding cassette, subfamily B, bacterial PglK